jgi:ribonuclease T
MKSEVFVSVDIEASGPIPGEYSMLSIGACLVGSTERDFYVELKPISDLFLPSALAVSGLSLEALRAHGADPALATAQFEMWVESVTPLGVRPVYVALNATFDWMFTHYYFQRFLGRDPFGVGGLDIKAYYMGLTGCAWGETSKSKMDQSLLPKRALTHHALEDAVWQAEVFENLMNYGRLLRSESAGT